MSVVTNVVLVTELDDRATEVNQYLASKDLRPLLKVDDHWTGRGKAMECEVWIGAFNYFDSEDFIAYCEAIEWESPAKLVMSYDDGRMEAIDLADEDA